MNFGKTVKRLLMVTPLVATTFLPFTTKAQAQDAAWVSSSFDSSCFDIRYRTSRASGVPYISATCRRHDGSRVYAGLGLRGIHNKNGQLRQNPLIRGSSFHNSCNNISIFGDQLTASCLTGNGSNSRTRTTITLVEITNSDGGLHYEHDRLINRAANAIVNHSYKSHVLGEGVSKGGIPYTKEFGDPPPSRAEFKRIVVDIIKNPQEQKTINRRNGLVKVYWKNGTIVFVQPGKFLSRSTAFRPSDGKAYYNRQR